jgi:hypothetical protein
MSMVAPSMFMEVVYYRNRNYDFQSKKCELYFDQTEGNGDLISSKRGVCPQELSLNFFFFLPDDLSLAVDGTDTLGHLKAASRYREFRRTEGISTTALVSRILARINGVVNCQVSLISSVKFTQKSCTLQLLVYALYAIRCA